LRHPFHSNGLSCKDQPTANPASKALQDCCVVTYSSVTMEMKLLPGYRPVRTSIECRSVNKCFIVKNLHLPYSGIFLVIVTVSTLTQCDYYTATNNPGAIAPPSGSSQQCVLHHNQQCLVHHNPLTTIGSKSLIKEVAPRQTPLKWSLNTQRILSTGFIHHPETSNRFSALMEADSADRQHNADPEHPPLISHRSNSCSNKLHHV
jgi:hypothetical protein